MVLVPFRKDLYDLKEDDYIDANFTTMHLGEIPYVIGFMPIKEECFEGYMKDFWAEINADMLIKREGRCIIGKNPDGSVKTCPYTRRCKGCPNKGLLERYNPNRIEMLSIDYEYDGETFDIEDTTQPPLEDQVLDKLCPSPTVEELQVQLVLEGMLLTTDSGDYRLATFIKPELMSKLYEKFILEYYNQEHKELDASASQIPWGLDDGIDAMLPVMQTDIMLTKGEKTLIIDAKYYSSTLQQHYDRMTIYSNNLYQIFTYVKNKEVELKDKPHEISGMLLYAKTDEETYPDNDYKMSGNRIGVHTLDLNVEFPRIREQLDGIAARYFAYATALGTAMKAE